MTPERTAKVKAVLNNRQNDLTVIMENVTDPHNISAVMRSCDAVGISEIYILNTQINQHKRFGNKSSSSAKKWMQTKQFTDQDECLKAVKEKYDKIYATHLGEKAQSIYSTDFTHSCALVFGNEKVGVSDALLKECDGNVVIPQVGMISSLNISVACAVTIYEAFRQKSNAQHYGNKKLDQTQESELLAYWNISEKI